MSTSSHDKGEQHPCMHACMHACVACTRLMDAVYCTLLTEVHRTPVHDFGSLGWAHQSASPLHKTAGDCEREPEQKHKAKCVRNSQALPPSLAVCLCISRDISKFHQGNNTYVRPAHWRNPFRKQTECKLCTGVEPRQAMSNASCSSPVLLPFSRRLQLLTCAHTHIHTPE